RRASRADRVGLFEIPHALAEAEILGRKRPYRTDVDGVQRIVVVERLALHGADFAAVTAVEDAELIRLRHFFGETHATRAQNAALGIEHHGRTEVDDFVL